MYKKLINTDEIAESHKSGNSLSKVDAKVKKQMLDSKKPINPKMIFDGKISKKISNQKYKKPTVDERSDKAPIINITDW